MVSYSKFLPTFMPALAAWVLSTHSIEAGPPPPPPTPTTRTVNSASNDPTAIGTLPYWLLNANNGDTIDCSPIAGQSITLTSSLPAITQSYTINGASITINGASNYQAFQVASGTVAINNVTVKNALSKGGDGGSGGSGGGGAVGGGGALYVHGSTSVTLTASGLLNNSAQGGDGGSATIIGNAGGGGGGGFGGGNGGNSVTAVSTGGGGGGHSNGGSGGSNSSLNGSNGVYFGGGGGGAAINSVTPGGNGGNASPTGTFVGGAQSGGNGGGGAGDSENGVSATGTGGSGMPGNGGNGIGTDALFGAGGGGGAASETGFPGGTGIGAAGGGGGSNYSGGAGGTLGGGGGGGWGLAGGDGGFGAGGGGGNTGGTGGGGFGAGGGNGASDPNNNGGGGGGSGLGGAIFIQSGGNLTIVDATQISGNTAIAGMGGSSTNTTDPDYIAPGNGAALGYDIFMREQGSITFDLSNILTLATPIEGDQTNGPNSTGGLLKSGEGTLQLNGANTYSGMTTVLGGTLNLNGSVIGSTLVGPGGTLSGNATISGNLTNFGILAPGNSIGTINTTNLVLTPSSLVEIEVASNGTNDLIAASATAQINGTLEVIPLPGSFSTVQSYTIITAAGGRTGTFSTVKSSVPSLLEVLYDPNAVLVKVLPISALTLNSNAAAAASCYLANGSTAESDVETVSTALLTLNTAKINAGFNQMQPSSFSGLAWSQIENTLFVRSSYSQRLEEFALSPHCCDDSYVPCVPCVWGEAIGAWQKQNADSKQCGYTDWTGGATVGLDALWGNVCRLGIAASYTHSRLNWKKSVGCADTNSYYGGLYANGSKGCGYVNAMILGAYSHYHTNRHLHFATINRHAKSSHHSSEGLAGLEAGFKFCCREWMHMIPFVRADYIYLSRQGFKEHGACSLDLKVDRHQTQVVQSEAGVLWTGRYVSEGSCESCESGELCEPCASGTFVPRIRLSYIHDAPIRHRHMRAHFVHSDCTFTVQGLNFRRNLGAVSLGLTYRNCNDTLSVLFRYDGQFGKDYQTQAANIALYIKF